LCADERNIGLRHQGRFPVRGIGQGRVVMNGRDSNLLWKGFLPLEDLPQVLNPSSGYLRSANNTVVGADYGSFLGWDYEESYRALRLREVLESKPLLTPAEFMQLQNNILDPHARKVLPQLLNLLAA